MPVATKTKFAFDPVGECLTPALARRLLEHRVSPAFSRRLDELAELASDGSIAPEQREEYDYYLRSINLIGLLQVKARAKLKKSGRG
jgi:hypothetical protein